MLWPLVRLVMAAGFVAAVAVSLLAPVSWSDYWRYVLLRFGWQMVAAIMTAAAALLVAMLVSGRRKTSGVLALGMFVSIVAHMMIASLFSGYVLSNPEMPPVANEGRFAVSPGVPQLTESLLSEEMRGQFTAIAEPDQRELTVEPQVQADMTASRIQRVKAKVADALDREPLPERVQAVPASEGKAAIRDALAAAGGRRPDVDKAVVVALAQVQPAGEASPSQPAPRSLSDEAHAGMSAAELAASKNIPVAPAAGDLQRAPERGKTEIGGIRHELGNVDDLLSAARIKERVNALALSAKALRAENTAESRGAASAKRAMSSMEVAHVGMSTPGTPAPAKVSRELKSVRSDAAGISLSDAAPVVVDQRPRLDSSTPSGTGVRRQAAARTDRITDAFQPMTGSGIPAPAPASFTSARKEVAAGRVRQGLDLASGPPAVAKATVQLQGRTAPERTLAGALPGAGTAGASGSAGRQEQLQAAGRRVDNRALAAVGRRAESIENVAVSSGMGAELPDDYYSRGVEIGKSGMDEERLAAGTGGEIAGPSFELATASRAAGGARVAQFDVPGVQASFTPAPVDGVRATAAVKGRSTGLVLADVGGGAAPAAPVAAPGGGSTGATQRVMAGAGQEFSGGKRQTGKDWALQGAAVASPRRGMDEDFHGTMEPGGSLAGNLEDVTSGGWAGTVAAVPEDLATVAAGSRAAGAGAVRADIIAGSIRGIAPSGGEAMGDSGSTRGLERGNIGMQFEKASIAISDAEAGGAGGRVTLPVAARVVAVKGSGRGVSLAGGDGVAVEHRGAGGSGMAPEGALNFKSVGAGGGVPKVAFGSAAMESARGEGAGGEGMVSRGSRGSGAMPVAKAGGYVVADAGLSGRDWLDVGSASMSLPGGRMHARMEGGAIDGGGHGGISALPSQGASGGKSARLLIADELSAVPRTVAQKAIYRLRAPERRKEMAREFGGSDQTEQAVEAALAWMAKAQSDDGRWDVDGFKTLSRCGGPGDRSDEDVALTGLCLLSYLGAGYTHVKGEHKEAVRKALNWLMDGQKADGNLQREGQMYGQAMATAALCESYSMTGDKRLLEPIEKAVGFIARAQNPGAGWRYEPRKDSDTSVTGWQVLALKSAMIAGVKVAPEHFQWVEEWLGAVRRGNEGGFYAYMPGQGATPTMTAEGWFCQLMMQEKTRMRGQNETIPYLMEHLPAWSSRENGVNLYFWYYSTLALYMSGAPEFAVWNKALVNALLTGQVKRGAAVGSWDPVCVLGPRGGRIYMTATAALCLEVYYRYLPFYKQR